MNPWIHRTFIYRPALLLRGEHATWRFIDEKRRLERVSSDELRHHVATRLAALLTHAVQSSAFYRARWTTWRDVTPDNVFDVFASLPFVVKRDLQSDASAMRVANVDEKIAVKSTGGSTAEPVTVWKNATGMAEERAATWAALAWTGIQPSDRVARFWSSPLNTAGKRKFRLADIAMNRIRLSAFNMDDASLEEYWNRCLHFRPAWLYGYASMIDLFAAWVESRGKDGRALGLKAVVPTSEPLYQAQRERIARAFGCAIENEYGCGEVGAIAYECESGQMHIMADNVVCELLRDDGMPARPGEIGDVVVTDLTNTAMPLIRYRLGDRAEAGDTCPCGRSFPTVRRIIGRAYDEVYTPAGRRWNGWQMHYYLSTLMGERGGFRQYQVVQDGPETLDVRLVADSDVSPELVATIQSFVRDNLDGMRATVRRVEAVERSKSGKLRVVRNDWRPQAEAADQADVTGAPDR